MAGEEPLKIVPDSTLCLDGKSIKLDKLTNEKSFGTLQS